MKSFALAAALAVLGTAAFANPVEGVWQTKKDDDGYFGHVEIKPCGPAFCGTLIRAFNPGGQEVDSKTIGRMIIIDMVAYPDGRFDDGKVFSPDRGKTYDAEMTLTGDSLAVRGCVLGLCRNGGVWKRVTD
jgi:uncharacterized protein (DUF2147 family)